MLAFLLFVGNVHISCVHVTFLCWALLRLERTMNLLCHWREGREGGEGGGEGRGGREGRDECHTYSNGPTIFK